MPYGIMTRDKPNHLRQRTEAREEHVTWLEDNKDKILAAGPMTNDDGRGGCGGVGMVDIEPRKGAFIQEDPRRKAGPFAGLEIVRWRKSSLDQARMI